MFKRQKLTEKVFPLPSSLAVDNPSVLPSIQDTSENYCLCYKIRENKNLQKKNVDRNTVHVLTRVTGRSGCERVESAPLEESIWNEREYRGV